MNINFKYYSYHDYEELWGMVNALYNEDNEGQPMNEEKVSLTIAEYNKNPEKLKIILFVNDKTEIIGYSIVVYYWSNEYGGNILNIDELYVKETYRSQGIGTYFIRHMEKEENIVALQLETTPSNKRVYKYYNRLGFVQADNNHLMKRIK